MSSFQSRKYMLTELNGQIERITFASEESGFTVARVKVKGHRDLVTVVGNLMSPMPGEIIRMKGKWSSHAKYGEQFSVQQYHTAVPASVVGIRKYLGSGLIKGVGPVTAGRIVNKFGADSLEIIENDIKKLHQVNGIGKKRIEMIAAAWEEQKEIRDVMIFLQSHDVSSGYACKIFKQYGNGSIAVVQENPYRLAMDIFGIGFVTADSIAEKLGFAKDSDLRIRAGVIYVLHQLADEGNVYYPYEDLIVKCVGILEVDADLVAGAIGRDSADRLIVVEDLNKSLDDLRENSRGVYLAKFHVSETSAAVRLKRLTELPKSIRHIKKDKALEWVQDQLSITLAKKQKDAIMASLESKVMVITGGPGTGKTTIINAVLKIFSRVGIKILLAAPTGRAAKKLSETTGLKAKTIHRLLEFSFAAGGFKKNDTSPLKCDLLIIDEASMIDMILMHHLLKAVPLGATLILVGDVNQLPSVGAGNVLNDIIESNTVNIVRLDEIFRQAKQSRIIVNAHKINKGIIPRFDSYTDKNDFYFINQQEPERVVEIIIKLVTKNIPRRFGFDPFDEIQVLTPMHRGVAGASNLNKKLQSALNPGGKGMARGSTEFKVNDKVMQIKNNYDKDVFNGDMGRIMKILPELREVKILFDGRIITYDFMDMDELVLAYAVSVHKSQGSEYPVVIIPILTQHYILLQRNLIYTAVTRGRKLVVMVGTRKALAIGVKNNKIQKRYTCLKDRLMQTI